VKPIKLLLKSERQIDAFSRLGNSWEFDDCGNDTIQMFVGALYGNARIRKVNELRYVILQTKCGGDIAFKKLANFDLSALPPCIDCLEQHVKRANYQVEYGNRHSGTHPGTFNTEPQQGSSVDLVDEFIYLKSLISHYG